MFVSLALFFCEVVLWILFADHNGVVHYINELGVWCTENVCGKMNELIYISHYVIGINMHPLKEEIKSSNSARPNNNNNKTYETN